MNCIAPERFVEWLEEDGLPSATPDEGRHLAACGDCREAWAGLAGADRLLVDAKPVAAPGRLALLAVFVAAAAVLIAVGVAMWGVPPEGGNVPAASQDPPKYEPQPTVTNVIIEPRDPREKAGDPTLVMVKVAIYRSEEDLFHGAAKSLPFAGLLDAAEAERVEQRLKADPKAKLISAPTLSLVDDTEGTMFIGEQIHAASVKPTDGGGLEFTVDQGGARQYAIEFDAEGKALVRTGVDPIRTGLQMLIRPVADLKRHEILIKSLRIELSQAGELQKTVTPYGTIESPVINRVTFTLSRTLPEGASLLVGPIYKPMAGPPEPLWALVSARVLRATGIAGKVTAVNAGIGLVVISVGRDDGVAVGQEFEIRRGGNVMAKITIESVNANWSAGKIQPVSKAEDIRVGDDAGNGTSR